MVGRIRFALERFASPHHSSHVAQLWSLGRAFTSLMKRGPIVSGVGVALMALAILLPFVLGPERGGQLDIQLRYFLPFVGAALAVAGFVRRERVLWPILGLLVTGIYVGLHLIATA